MGRQPITTEGTFISTIQEVDGETVTTITLQVEEGLAITWKAEYLSGGQENPRILLHKPVREKQSDTPPT